VLCGAVHAVFFLEYVDFVIIESSIICILINLKVTIDMRIPSENSYDEEILFF
jgi:hypothetical protein